MNKKLIRFICIPLVILISLIIGFLIGGYLFSTSLVVFEYNGSRMSCLIRRGQIESFSSNVIGDINADLSNNFPKFNLDGIHNNQDAVNQIVKQVSEHGGNVISVMMKSIRKPWF